MKIDFVLLVIKILLFKLQSVYSTSMFRVAVLENQNKALIEELKSLKELYTGISWEDWLKYNSTYTSLENLKFKAVIKYDSFPGGKMMWDIINILWRYFSTKQGRRPNSMSTEMWQVISSERNRQCLKNLPLQTRSDLMYALSCGPYSRPLFGPQTCRVISSCFKMWNALFIFVEHRFCSSMNSHVLSLSVVSNVG